MAEPIYNSCTVEEEAGPPGVQSHPQMHSDFEVSLGYTRPCLYINIYNVCQQRMYIGRYQSIVSNAGLQPEINFQILEKFFYNRETPV